MNKDNALLVLVESIDGKQIVSDHVFCGWLGASEFEWLDEAGYEIKLTTLNGLSVYINTNKHRNLLPIGSVEFVKKAAEIMETKLPAPINIPESLKPVIDRKIWLSKRNDLKFPCFIKPNTDLKLFTGFVAKSQKDLDLYPELIGFDGDFLCSEVFDGEIKSEWRCFVLKGEVINCSCYSGDSLYFPEKRIINELISAYTNAPSAYSLDVAVTEKDFGWKYNKTELIEVNDAWAIGSYGCNPQDYFKFLKTRWFEILKK